MQENKTDICSIDTLEGTYTLEIKNYVPCIF